MQTTSSLLVASGVGLLSFVALRSVPDAHAWSAQQCDDRIRSGIRSKKYYRINRCTVLPGSDRELDLIHATNAWDFPGTKDRFELVEGPSTCGIPPDTEDDDWDVAFVLAALIDDNAGLTVAVTQPCVWPYTDNMDGELVRGDVLIATNVDTGPIPEDSTELGAREVALHEFGHVLGAGHEPDEMTVMCTARPGNCGKVGARTVTGHLVNHTDALMPDDIDFKVEWHNADNGSLDMAASGHEYKSGGGAKLTHPTLINHVRCPGETLTVRWSHAITGETNISSSNPFSGKIVLSTNNIISAVDMTLANAVVHGNRGQFFTNTSVVTIPNVVAGDYWIGWVVDVENSFSELEEGNNAVMLNMRVLVPTTC